MSDMELCEWNPVSGWPADNWGHCKNEAVLSVGADPDNWHLCASCAALPRFSRKRRRVPIGSARANLKGLETDAKVEG